MTDTMTPPEVAEAFDADTFLPVPRASDSFPFRVFSKIEVTCGCWYWVGTLDGAGYGILGRGRRGAGNIAAHRAVWELLVGQIPDGMQFDHLCRNRACVNPDHGEIVTPDENKRRGYGPAPLHAARTTCTEGHPLDGRTGGRGSPRKHRYCKTCARSRANQAHAAKKAREAAAR